MDNSPFIAAVTQASPTVFDMPRTIEKLPEVREDLRRNFEAAIIVAPLGNILVTVDLDGELIQMAGLGQDDIACGKYGLDIVGHYARPDVFHLHVDKQVQLIVVLSGGKSDV